MSSSVIVNGAGASASTGAGKVTLEHLRNFCGVNAKYYLSRFEHLAHQDAKPAHLNWAALFGGPYWAVARGMWLLFWITYAVDVIALGWLFAAETSTGVKAVAAAALVANRIGLGLVADHSYWQAFCAWRSGGHSDHRFNLLRLFAVALITVPAALLAVAGVAQMDLPAALREFPASRALSTQTQVAINDSIAWTSTHLGPFFDSITNAVRWVLDLIENVLLSVPWPALAAIVGLVAWRAGGIRMLALAGAILAYLGFFGYWEKSISTMSLVAASVVICVLFGVPLGILCAKYRSVNRVADPLMDIMQTMPSFVYLLPAIAFFSIGKPPAILATVVFAMPPVIKLTALGIRQIPENVKEAMLAFGASPLQLLAKAELPMAVPSIMAGINQSIMMSLSMVVIGALIGAGGLGYDVLAALQQMDNGAGILAGAAIVMCAMLLDRLIQGPKKNR